VAKFNEIKRVFFIQFTAFVAYFSLFSLLFFFMIKTKIINKRFNLDFLLYGLIFSLFSFLIPLSLFCLNNILKKKFDSK